MGWFGKAIEEKWSPWSKPVYCGGGRFRQVRFRLSDNKMQTRDLFVNYDQREMDAAWNEYKAGPGSSPAREGADG